MRAASGGAGVPQMYGEILRPVGIRSTQLMLLAGVGIDDFPAPL